MNRSTGNLASSNGHVSCHDGPNKVFSDWKGHRDRQPFEELRDDILTSLCPRIFDNARHHAEGHTPSASAIGELIPAK